MQTSEDESTGVNVSVRDPAYSASPKRKREPSDDQGRAQSPSSLRTDLPTRSYHRDNVKQLDSASPRSKIGEELEKLSINFDIPPSKFTNPSVTGLSSQLRASSPFDVLASPGNPILDSNLAQEQLIARPQQPAPIISMASTDRTQQGRRAASDISSSSAHKAKGVSLTPSLNLSLTSSAPSTEAGLESKKKHQRVSRTRSPSPTSSVHDDSDLVWTAREITGHDPTDPADDGCGMNGIGFRPTPSTAQARAQKRRQQLADWRSREAKDARQRRFDRRKGCDQSLTREAEMETPTRRKAVRFVED